MWSLNYYDFIELKKLKDKLVFILLFKFFNLMIKYKLLFRIIPVHTCTYI